MDIIKKIQDKFPSLQGPDGRKKVSVMLIAAAVLILVVILNIAKTVKKEPSAPPVEQKKVETLDTPDGEGDKALGADNLEIRTDLSKTSHRDSRMAKYGEEMYVTQSGSDGDDGSLFGTDDKKKDSTDTGNGVINREDFIRSITGTAQTTDDKSETDKRMDDVKKRKERARDEIRERRADARYGGYGAAGGTSVPPETVVIEEPQDTARTEEKKEETIAEVSPVKIRRSGGVSSLDDNYNSGNVSSLDARNDYIEESESHPFLVMFAKDEKVSSGGRVSIRLLEDMIIDGIRIPENSHLSGICSVSESRLTIRVPALKVNDNIYALNMQAYDTDGIQGLYCAETATTKGLKQGKGEGFNLGRLILGNRIEETIANQIVTSGAQIIQNAAGNTTISVTAGYKFFLLKSKN